VALADPDSTHSEVFISGTEPFPPLPEGQPAIAAVTEASVSGVGPAGMSYGIASLTDTQGHKVYVNHGIAVSPSPSNGSRPIGAAQP
jgi:hypothetical protein